MAGNGQVKDEFNAGDIAELKEALNGLSGAGSDGTIALTPANTWLEVPDPPSIPSEDYVLVVSKENTAGTIRFSFDDGGTPSTTNGNKFTTDNIIVELAGGESIYFGSTDAGDDVNWTAKII